MTLDRPHPAPHCNSLHLRQAVTTAADLRLVAALIRKRMELLELASRQVAALPRPPAAPLLPPSLSRASTVKHASP